MKHPEYKPVSLMGCTLQMTCGACPEQYDVFRNGSQVGYLRLRGGTFRAHHGECGGPKVYESETEGDGSFEDSERLEHLTKAVTALLEYEHT